jgi:hypothetical protein
VPGPDLAAVINRVNESRHDTETQERHDLLTVRTFS